MRRYLILTIAPLLIQASCSSNKTEERVPSIESYVEQVADVDYPTRDTTLLDLYYGMDFGEEDYHCVLDSIPGLLSQFYHSRWKEPMKGGPDSVMYDARLRVYIDEQFPSRQVFLTISDIFLNKVKGSLEYSDIREPLSKYVKLDTLEAKGSRLIDICNTMFEATDNRMKTSPEDNYEKIQNYCTSDIATRIYENEEVATYLIQGTFDLNGSCGCTSSSNYISIEKSSGRILKYDDIVGKHKVKEISDRLYQAYVKECESNGYRSLCPKARLIDSNHRDNCALVKEGILFYYHPYEIGCGAEGQYNLIIDRI